MVDTAIAELAMRCQVLAWQADRGGALPATAGEGMTVVRTSDLDQARRVAAARYEDGVRVVLTAGGGPCRACGW